MQLIRKRGLYEASRIIYLPISEISANPDQPRRRMDTEEMQKLSESIEKYGVLQPLSVRRLGRGYELLSGERRMRAAMLAGLREVPCVIMDVNTRESAVLMLVENLLRRDLDFIEEARGLSRLVNMYGYSQEEAARLVGLTQPTVANKLRLLKMPPDLLLTIREAGLSERHARALLRLGSEENMIKVLEMVIKQDLNVAKTESFIEAFLTKAQNPDPVEKSPTDVPQQKSVYVIRDPRLLVNSIARGVKLLRKSGVNVGMEQQETETAIVLTVTIPK